MSKKTDFEIQDAEIERNITILKNRIERSKQQLREYQYAVKHRPVEEIKLINEAFNRAKNDDEKEFFLCEECGRLTALKENEICFSCANPISDEY